MTHLAVGLTIDLDTALNGWDAISMNDRGDGILREARCLVPFRREGLVSLPFIIHETNEYMATARVCERNDLFSKPCFFVVSDEAAKPVFHLHEF